jgi:AmiR/NasT family two-component response regulator
VLTQLEVQEPAQVAAAVEVLERENGQLREALASRIVIEQAKGVLGERYGLDMARSFELLRRAARSEHRRIHELAAEVLGSRRSPVRIDALAAEIAVLDGQGAAAHD